MHISDAQLQLIIQTLRESASARLIFLFGSVCRDTFRPDSDIDIAFLSDRTLASYEVWLVAQKLADELKRDVDLISLSSASTVLKAQIVGEGEAIFSASPNLLAEFSIRVLKDYALLNEERKEILANIRKEGKIYE
ncbi:nucleotidyltransferase domain-containing protein [Fodinisporobacter ferrooxydans]|uniref:Nucleotidyltransferase domain-containing protein n=1 Tax=Fodinisporobacter ferrooxydans TaxID=2901836 RepID=A0ABY4CPH5_9BACL|nr:nucleotidyltransferase domain-containing protein [Alicyclobacillaceae bacterium MYW30-H2]